MNAASLVGSVVEGRFEITGVLGEGGMGVVFRARHRFTGAEVALKMLHPHLRLAGETLGSILRSHALGLAEIQGAMGCWAQGARRRASRNVEGPFPSPQDAR